MESFRTAFNNFIMDRTIEVENKVIMKNKELEDVEDKIYEMYRKIGELLPDDMKNLILMHEELVNSYGALTDIIIYEQGLRDGVELIRILAAQKQIF